MTSDIRRGCRRKARAVAGIGVGGKRELRDDKHVACDVLHGLIHLPRIVRKNAVAQKLLREFHRFFFGVFALGADENHEAPAYFADNGVIDRHLRFTHALQNADHFTTTVTLAHLRLPT